MGRGLGRAGMEKRTERMREPDRGQERKGVKGAKGVMEDKEEGVSVSFAIRSLISHRTYTCTAYTLTALTHPLHYTVALDSGSEARFVLVRRQGRGLGI